MNTEYEEEKPGNLGVMLCYQSLNGHLVIDYFDTLEEAEERYVNLIILGRSPEIWKQVKKPR